MSADSPGGSLDYDLKVDDQVEKYVETKQKLTYFLISASVAVTAYLLNFVVEHRRGVGLLLVFVIASCLIGLATVGACLLNLHLEHRSHRLHLRYRYERKRWNDIPKEQQASWTRLNTWATWTLWSSFGLLFFQIALASFFFILFLILDISCTTMAKMQ